MSKRQRTIEGGLQHTVAGDRKADAENVSAFGAPAGKNVFDCRFDPFQFHRQQVACLRDFHILQRFAETHETEADRADVDGDSERQTPVFSKGQFRAGRARPPGFGMGKDDHSSLMKPRDDPVQGLLGEVERLGQVGALNPWGFPDQPQEVPFVAGRHPGRLCIAQKMRGNMF